MANLFNYLVKYERKMELIFNQLFGNKLLSYLPLHSTSKEGDH